MGKPQNDSVRRAYSAPYRVQGRTMPLVKYLVHFSVLGCFIGLCGPYMRFVSCPFVLQTLCLPLVLLPKRNFLVPIAQN